MLNKDTGGLSLHRSNLNRRTMTAQIRERLKFNGIDYRMASEPLEGQLETLSNFNELKPPNDACLRGYYGSWEIKNNKLFLVGLDAVINDYETVSLTYFYPGQTEVFAKWYTGKLRIPLGERIVHVRSDYDSVYEKDLFLRIRKGVLVKTWIINNSEDVTREDFPYKKEYQDYLRMVEERNSIKDAQRSQSKQRFKSFFYKLLGK